ncbi:MAG: oligosaccharide flippase family protein [bacterium]|nr:oligosaccharide flippase family protein [bacterium]
MAPRLLASGGQILASRVFQAGLNAVTGWMIARTLGPGGQGHYSLIITSIMFFAALLNGGLGLSAVPVLRQGKASFNNIIKSQFLWAALCGLFLSVLATMAWLFGIPDFVTSKIVLDSNLSLLILAGILVLLLFDLLFYSMIAAGRVVVGPFANLLRASVHLVLLLTVSAGFTLQYALSAWTVAQVVAVLVLLIVAFKTSSTPSVPSQPLTSLAKKLFKSGWVGQLSTLASMLHLRINLALVAIFYSSVETGIYSIAVLAGEFLWLLSGSLQPVVAWSAADTTDQNRDQVTVRAVRIALSVTLVAATFLAFSARQLFAFIFNNAYDDSVFPLYYLLPGIVIFAAGAVLAGDFIGRGRPAWNTQASFLTLAVNLLAAVILVPKLGISGAAIASTIAYIVGSLFMMYRFSTVSQIPIVELFKFSSADFQRK